MHAFKLSPLGRLLGLACVLLLLIEGCGRLSKRARVPKDVGLPEMETTAEVAESDSDLEEEADELVEEQKRSAELEQRLDESTRQVEQLRRELEATRRELGQPGRNKPSAPELWGHTPATLPGGMQAEDENGAEAPQTIIASLREALAREQQRRESIEKELARLKIETSAPVFGDTRVPEADFLAVKQELVELRRTLDQERRTREQIAEQLRALQARPAAISGGSDSAEMRIRLRKLEDDKRKILESLDRSVATSQRRASELERRLHNLRATGGRGDAVAAIQAENAALRASLDEERKRTELLAAKLKAAAKITDLMNDIGDTGDRQ